MGVNGLWNAIRPAMDSSTNLLQLSTLAFESTPNLRGLRVGIDASIWTYAQESKERSLGGETIVGPNLALRNLFYKCCILQKSGLLPLFVFDGPDRPRKVARGGGGYSISRVGLLFQKLLRHMGIEYRDAPGEAEAELAALSDRGIIDAILTDDVDTLVFAKSATVIRNWSATLSGNQGNGAGNTSNPPPSSQSTNPFPPSSQYPSQASTSQIPSSPAKSQSHSQSQSQSTATKANPTTDLAIYRSSTIFEIVGLDNHGMILMAVLLGGDYDPVGYLGLGEKTALGLAKGGFGTSLFEGTRRYGNSVSKLNQFLDLWRGEVADELASNSKKFLGSRKVKLSKEFREAKDFPRIDIINAYISPNVSREEVWIPLDWNKMVDLDGLVGFVREYFEWRDGDILMALRNRFFMSVVVRGVRQELLEEDKLRSAGSTSSNNRAAYHRASSPSSFLISPPSPSQLFNKITRTKTAQSTSFIDSYRLVLSETEFLNILDPIIADLPPILNPVQRYNDVGEIVIPRDEKARDGETKDLSHWVPKEFMVGKSARLIVRDYENVLWEKENTLREKEEIKIRKAREREDKLRMKIAKATTNSSPQKQYYKDAGSSQSIRGTAKGTAKANGKVPSRSPTSSSPMEMLSFAADKSSTATSKSTKPKNMATYKPSTSSGSTVTKSGLKRMKTPSPFLTSDEDEDPLPRHVPKSPRKNRGQTTASNFASSSTWKLNDRIEISSDESEDDDKIRGRSTSYIPAGIKKPEFNIFEGKGKEKEKVVEENASDKGMGRGIVNDLPDPDRWIDIQCIELSDSD